MNTPITYTPSTAKRGRYTISESPLRFKRITVEDMRFIYPYLCYQRGRTTDFSIGGLLMWVDVFNYEYCIYRDTLFIKGVVENDLTKPAFSVPVGRMALSESIQLLKNYCAAKNITLELSAVPEDYLPAFRSLVPMRIEELKDWADYLYDIEPLATLSGKKLMKKRNHFNKFKSVCPDYELLDLTPANVHYALEFMDIFDMEGDETEMAVTERAMTRKLLRDFRRNPDGMEGAILIVDGAVVAFTVGDIIDDTLFIHIEKATRAIPGSYEAINKLFAQRMLERHPELRYVNREDDSGDAGLRKAKESYHPVKLLKKYNILF